MTQTSIPITGRYDVVVVGGSVRAVAAATVAAENGCEVFLAAPRPYLGDDMCSTLLLWQKADESSGPITRKIFNGGNPATPMRVKKVLDEACLDAGVTVCFGTFPTEVIQNDDGNLAGCVVANRAGRQAVMGKMVVDCTHRGTIARLAGASFKQRAQKNPTARRVVLAGECPDAVQRIPLPGEKGNLSYYTHELDLDLGDESFIPLARAEQLARERTYRQGQQRASERLIFVPSDAIESRGETGHDGTLNPIRIGNFQPRHIERLYVLGPSAGISARAAEDLIRPCCGERVGRFVGRTISTVGRNLSACGKMEVAATRQSASLSFAVKEPLGGMRSTPRADSSIPDRSSSPPLLAEYDVVVAGGGTSGACAAIGAARQGGSVLVIEYQEGLGGVGTVGLIGKPYHGRSAGFSDEVPFPGDGCTIDDKMEWYRREIRNAGGDIWLGAVVCGALVDDGRVRGVVLAGPDGRGIVRANTVIDATGNADVAAAAGAECQFGHDPTDIALQGTGLPPRPLDANNVNSDYLLVDECDVVDTSRTFLGARQTMDDSAYDSGTLIQTRERRRVVGDHTLSYLDQVAGRTYPDSICYSASDYDSHGYPSLTFFAMLPHDAESRKENHPAPGGSCYTPYRCLLPRGLDGLLVTGLGISMHRDASAMIRMQRDLHNQGYAAGVAGAMAAEMQRTVREIDVQMLQRHLVEVGSLPAEALEHADSFPLSDDAVVGAVEELATADNPTEAGRPLAVILSHQDTARPAVEAALEQAEGAARIMYAKILGFLGSRAVIPILRPVLEMVDEWDAKILQGHMAEYAHLPTPIDGLIMALGWPGDAEALETILGKIDMLDAGVTLSHHRAVAVALERIAHPSAAEPLAKLLGKPDMQGHVMSRIEPLYDQPRERRRRTGPLREIVLARALYRCGDYKGLGKKILMDYREDIRGLFARHATAVLGGR